MDSFLTKPKECATTTGGCSCYTHVYIFLLWMLFFQISGGWRHTMALATDGKLYGWGWNKVGYLVSSRCCIN